MKDQIPVKEIVKQYLIKHGYDGLCRDYCGCELDDLMPCEEISPGCIPGYRHTDPDGEVDFIITPNKEGKVCAGE